MFTIGVTGHSDITPATSEVVRKELVALLEAIDSPITGLTCLARGADQTFADAVPEVGGELVVIAPARDYFDLITDTDARRRCNAYLAAAMSTTTMDHDRSGSAAYLAASRYLVDRCDLLVAVWDGGSDSGTADAVSYAQEIGRDVVVVWPVGAVRG